ncbi:MAG: c-type cytochrome, partial [Acidobacteriota bacterium]|nr:c-type cytochrome [Acidobacteriota bacterium]
DSSTSWRMNAITSDLCFLTHETIMFSQVDCNFPHHALTPPRLQTNDWWTLMKSFFRILIPALFAIGSACAADATAGAATYSSKCKGCHGADGTGNPAMAKAMKVEFKPLSAVSDEDLKAAETGGHGKMKPVASVAGADLDNLVAAIHAMKK